MLELAGVRHAYEGRVVLDLERFAVPPGALIAIVGHNGSGKSTLLRLLALVERPAAGEGGGDAAGAPGRGSAPGAPAGGGIPRVSRRRGRSQGRCGRSTGLGLKVRGRGG